MKTIWHVSKSAKQDIFIELYDIGVLTGEITYKSIEKLLQEHNGNTDNTGRETLWESNLLCYNKRSLLFKTNFPVIEPVEYILDNATRKKILPI